VIVKITRQYQSIMLVKFRSSISKFYLNYLKYLDGYIAPYLQEKKKEEEEEEREREREREM
jgi:hypothetical protein